MNKKRIVILSVGTMCILGSAFLLSGCSKATDKKTEQSASQSISQGLSQDAKQETKKDATSVDGEVAKSKDAQGALPAEAVSACSEKSEGDTCEMTMPAPPNGTTATSSDNSAKTVSGTCKKQNEQLACMPAGRPNGAPGQNAPAAK